MTPVQALRESIAAAFAADAAFLAPPANANEVALVKADFVEVENIAIGDLTLADFTDADPISAGVGRNRPRWTRQPVKRS